MDEHDLLQYLKKLLQDRGCYLALIDDIWDIKAWIQIKDAFPDQKNGSRIIITTRNKKVAEMADDKCFVHQLRFLTENESWELFCKRAKPTTQNMEKLGKEMVGKCRGLPLAIVILNSLLLHNMTNVFWSSI
ncbi:disease resistance protein RPP13-like [Apium graveolens]|uniref:disease resistance protein RPP13-like n=1 Tax=Apium graveolens TaxID=4045 RepID=UPI003D7BB882